jgi:nucleotide-binding universal stress UspA family protein
MKTIIVGTDFSQSSINACRYAAFLAQTMKCKLTLFNMFEAPIIHSNMGMYGITYTSERKSSELKLDKIIKQLCKDFPSIKIAPFVTAGFFKQELAEFTKTHLVEAIVMGLETKHRMAKFIFGSHGTDLVGKIDAPVIIVPEKYKTHRLSNILLAVDNNEKVQKTPLLSFKRFYTKQKDTQLNILHVRTEDEIFIPQNNSIKFNGKSYAIQTHRAKSLKNGVKNYCHDHTVDLVAIISKKHSIFYNLFLESHTKKLAFVAKVPILAIHE